MKAVLDKDGTDYCFDGKKWQQESQVKKQQQPRTANNILLQKQSGEYLKVCHLQEDMKLKGQYVESKIKIPHHCIVISVNIRVTKEISNAKSFNVGVKEDSKRYGSKLSAKKDATNIGLTNSPMTYWQDTAIVIEANDGKFTDGIIKVSIQYLQTRGAWNWE